jgi:aminopeptidase
MVDPRVTKLAELIVDYSIGVKEGQQVLLRGQPVAAPLIQELYRLVLLRGGHPYTQVQLPGLDPIYMQHANDAQLQFVSPIDRYIVENFDARIRIMSETNTRELSHIDPVRQALYHRGQRILLETIMERSGQGTLRWNVCMYPTDAYAQEADMSLGEFENFVYAACLADRPDPAGEWRQVKARQQGLVDWLAGKSEVHLIGPDTDLRVGISGRPFINCFGDCNLPDGEVFTGPEENRVDGMVRFSFPAINEGREVEDVRLWFEGGRVVKWSAAKNEAYLAAMLDTDEGSRRLGEFAFGTNYGIQRFTKNILFDEKIGGTAHMALGDGYRETGSQNRSAIHWDMICDLRQGSEVWVDGELFARDGQYVNWAE